MSLEKIVILTLLFEIMEVLLQYKMTLKESLIKLYRYYNSSPFLFFAVHIGYIWIIFLSINHFNSIMFLAIFLKTLDIYTKIVIIQKIFIKQDREYIDSINPMLEKTPIWLYFVGVLTYPYIVYLALS